MYIKKITALIAATSILSCVNLQAEGHGDNYDLDDIRDWDIVSIETCLDAATDTIPGHAHKVEMKMEGDDPVYEFDIHTDSGKRFNVECNAEEGFVTEIEQEVDADNPYFKKMAKISQKEAKKTALTIHPGEVMASELEIGFDGSVTYEFDIRSDLGYEIKVDVDAVTGMIEEANIELYEIGNEKE